LRPTPRTWRIRSLCSCPLVTGSPSSTPGIGFPIRRLLRLAGLWWRYFNPLKLIKLRGFSPQANYTYRATAACRRSECQLLRIEGIAWSTQRIPMSVNLNFIDPEPLLSHSSSASVILTRLSGPRSRPTTSQKIW
jgi:hypothetical protein